MAYGLTSGPAERQLGEDESAPLAGRPEQGEDEAAPGDVVREPLEVRRNLVEQQYARSDGIEQPGVGEDNRDQHRLLLAGRALVGGQALGRVNNTQIAPVADSLANTALGTICPTV